MSSLLAYEAEEKDYDAPEQLERRQVSSALADEAEKEEAGCSGAPALAEKEAECRHAPEKEAECPDHRRRRRRRSAAMRRRRRLSALITRRRRSRRRRRSALTRRSRPVRKLDELLPP